MKKWNLDNAHSEILFSVRHMMISRVRGKLQKFDVDVQLDLEKPEEANVEARIEAASITTGETNRDNHLRSPDFLNAEKYPYLTFKNTRVEEIDKKHARIFGDLTIQDVTRPVTLDVEFAGTAKSPFGTTNAGFSAKTAISRKEWNLTWNVALETGGWLVGDEIEISIEIQLIQQDAQKAVGIV